MLPRTHRLSLVSSFEGLAQTTELDQRHAMVWDTFEHMDAICFAIMNSSTTSTDRRAISNSVYHSEYRLSKLNDELTAIRNGQNLTKALAAAAQLFLHIFIRSLPASAPRHLRLFEKLRLLLESDEHEIGSLNSRPSLPILLWMHFVGATDEGDSLSRGLHVLRLEQLCLEMGIDSYANFERALKDVLWIDEPGMTYAGKAWEDIWVGLELR